MTRLSALQTHDEICQKAASSQCQPFNFTVRRNQRLLVNPLLNLLIHDLTGDGLVVPNT